MIVSPVFAGRRYAVLGLARSGLATVGALIESGALVTAWDERPEARAIVTPGASLADPMMIDLTGFDGIVVSPGVPLNTHPIAAKARDAGVPVIGDIELFAQARASLPPHKVVGITGTNGKSTTTALIHHILVTAGVPTTMGGNIGLPILAQAPLTPNANGVGVYVLELSSFQIDLTHSLDCDIAVLTNITPDHLDRYDGFEAYAASKMRLVEMQSTGHWAVLHFGEEARTKREADVIWLFEGVPLNEQASWPALQGPHNSMNAQAAIVVAQALGIASGIVQAALRTYPGLPHRMERVAEVAGVLYVNDSKATNATSAAPALAAYPKVRWIVGGRRKTDDLDACVPHYGNVVSAYTIGESAELYKELLLRAGIHAIDTGTLDAAVKAAAQIARPGETVLLSPACASYDQFKDYEARGDAFKAAVALLGGDMKMEPVTGRKGRFRRGKPPRLGRADRSPLGRWFWEIDLVLLALVTVLIGIGLIAVAAASPAAGVRYSDGAVVFPPLYYFYRQCVWLAIGIPVMFVVSMLPKELARRLSLLGAVLFVAALAATPVIGHQVNGARRWIGVGMAQVQPSEFLKPLYVVALAWLLSLKQHDRSLPVVPISLVATAVIAGLLMKQPDFGQTIMFLLMWTALLTLSGAPMKGLAALAGLGVAAFISAYFFYSVARLRIDNFLFDSGDSYQVKSARRTLMHGGLFGTGPGAGTMKFKLPEPHTDYIFSVIGEEFGLIACLGIALIYVAIIVRVFVKLLDEEDSFTMLAAAGLATQFGAQAIINMAVNLQLAPSKGMTLPFISYGGSSMIALSMGFGLLLAFTRRNPYLTRSPYVVTWNNQR